MERKRYAKAKNYVNMVEFQVIFFSLTFSFIITHFKLEVVCLSEVPAAYHWNLHMRQTTSIWDRPPPYERHYLHMRQITSIWGDYHKGILAPPIKLQKPEWAEGLQWLPLKAGNLQLPLHYS